MNNAKQYKHISKDARSAKSLFCLAVFEFFPIFESFSNSYRISDRRSEAKAAAARLRSEAKQPFYESLPFFRFSNFSAFRARAVSPIGILYTNFACPRVYVMKTDNKDTHISKVPPFGGNRRHKTMLNSPSGLVQTVMEVREDKKIRARAPIFENTREAAKAENAKNFLNGICENPGVLRRVAAFLRPRFDFPQFAV